MKKGVPLKAFVAAGAAFEPVANARVRFFNEHRFSWMEDGRESSGVMARSTEATTNAGGYAEALVLPGTVEVSCSTDGWNERKEVEVVEGEPAIAPFERPFTEPQMVVGQLVALDNEAINFANAKVHTGAIDGKSNQTTDMIVDETGKFEFATTATRYGIHVETADGKYSGTIEADLANTALKIPMLSMMDRQPKRKLLPGQR